MSRSDRKVVQIKDDSSLVLVSLQLAASRQELNVLVFELAKVKGDLLNAILNFSEHDIDSLIHEHGIENIAYIFVEDLHFKECVKGYSRRYAAGNKIMMFYRQIRRKLINLRETNKKIRI